MLGDDCFDCRDAWHVTASLHLKVHSVMIQLDSADAGQELQVAHVNVVRLVSGTIVHMDVCVSPTLVTKRKLDEFLKMCIAK
jgi:hypothetical protein